jgi:ceramide glucosyltransferase
VPGVTVIRPLCGLDNNLYNTLESCMRLDYPKYEVLFALQSEADEAIPVVEMVLKRYPHVDARIVISECGRGEAKQACAWVPAGGAGERVWRLYTNSPLSDGTKVGVNPKVNNLMEPFRCAKYDLLWVIDATIAVSPHVLGRMVDAFVARPGTDIENSAPAGDGQRAPPAGGQVGLVHQVPIAVVYQRSWGSLIEQAYLNSTHAKMYLSIVSVTRT